jgi:cysteinyl-tRNA synthetase
MANMKVLAEKFTNIFLEDLRALNIEVDKVKFPRASEYIDAQIAMIKTLEEKSYAYKAEDGVYFDTSHFPAYGALGGIDLEGLKAGARVESKATKRNPADFALWKFSKRMGWDSPWGKGFPGWHIECSAMARACLGEQIDIHTGGIEHIPVHHNNEIAQSESATGRKPFSRFWLHRNHLQLDGGKFAKSTGVVIYLSDVAVRGFHPLSLRYLFLGAHYRTPMNFTWEALGAAQTSYIKLLALRQGLKDVAPAEAPAKYKDKFWSAINDDLNTPAALAALWEMIGEKPEPSALRAALDDFDKVLGLKLAEPDEEAQKLLPKRFGASGGAHIDEEVRGLLKEREEARAAKDFAKADALRSQIADKGYEIEDSPSGPVLVKR